MCSPDRKGRALLKDDIILYQKIVVAIAETICLISECMTLDPGDILVMGTPGGVGAARKPPVFMKPGDVCEIEISSIGVLRNPIEQESR